MMATSSVIATASAWMCLLATASASARAGIAFDLPAQPLADSLRAVAQHTRSNILFDRRLVLGLLAQPLKANLSLEEALARLLAGTGLTYQLEDAKTVVILAAAKRPGQPLEQRTANENPTPALLPNVTRSNLGEVRVTATKREEGLQEIPVAVTALTRRRLDELHATQFQDYFRNVPGLMMDVDVQGHLDFSLRGTTSSLAGIPSTTASVAQYIDEIPVTTTQAQIDLRLIDIERIEVLRGPQGTLYGQGALGGAIRIITRQPDLQRFSASAEGQLGKVEQGGTGDQEGVTVNVPVMPGKLALRANFFRARDAGYVDLAETPAVGDPRILRVIRQNANTNTAEGGRVTALLAPSESWRMTFAAVRLDDRADMMGAYQPDMGGLHAPVSCGTEEPTPLSRCFYSARRQRADLYNLTVNADLGTAASLVVSSSLAKTERELSFIPVAAAAIIPYPDDELSVRAASHELRLSRAPGRFDRWDYLAGAFFSRGEDHKLGEAAIGAHAVPVFEETREAAIFGEVGYRAGDHWSTRLGIRSSRLHQEQRAGRVAGELPESGEANVVFDLEAHNKVYAPLNGRIALQYTFDANALLYGSVSSGFRKGGINLPGVMPSTEVPTFYEPDRSTNYEAGWKLSFPGLRATLNGAAFHIDWQNVQTMLVTETFPAANYYGNGDDARVNGLELEGSLALRGGLSLQSSFAFLDARSQSGRMPFVARVSGSVSLSYRRALSVQGLQGFGVLNAQYQGKRQTDFDASPGSRAPLTSTFAVMGSYWTTRAQIGIENERWRAAFYVDNLFDARGELLRFYSGQSERLITTRPRALGVFLRYSFN